MNEKISLKKILKSRLTFFILGGILFGFVGVGAASLIYSSDVTYDNTSSGLSSTTVQGALDELYEKAKNAPSCDSDGNCTVTCPDDKSFISTDTGYKCVTTAENTIKKLNVTTVTSGDGLYADTVTDGRYYYSGSSANNSIVFNGEPYKILAIENDGRIKIIKMVNIENLQWNTAGTNVWANSPLKSYLEETWLPTQESGEDYQYLSDTNEWYVGAVSSKSDIAENYTAEKKTVVNSAVGLISTSEFLKSKYTGSTFLNVSINWWTISPYASSSSDAWFVYSSGLGKSYVYRGSYAVFPVLYLKSSVSLTGSGTSTDPYCIKGSTCPKDLNFSQRTS